MVTTSEIGLATIVKQSDKILVQNLDEDAVMANIDSGYYFGVNKTSKRIWEIIATPNTIADICSCLLNEYNIDTVTCETQVMALINELVREGLVEVL